jgi:hypothetical protein
MLVSFWHAAGRVDEKLITEQEFFGNSSDQVASVIADARLGGFEVVEGRRWPLPPQMYFNPAADSEVILEARKIGNFYRRNLFDFDAAIEGTKEVCGTELILPGRMKSCRPSSIEVRYDRKDPHRFTLPAFNMPQDLSLLDVLWKVFICLLCAIIVTVLILFNGWIAVIAAAIGAGIGPRRSNGSRDISVDWSGTA